MAVQYWTFSHFIRKGCATLAILIRRFDTYGDFANRAYQTAILVGPVGTCRAAPRRPDCLDHRDRRQCARAAPGDLCARFYVGATSRLVPASRSFAQRCRVAHAWQRGINGSAVALIPATGHLPPVHGVHRETAACFARRGRAGATFIG